MKDWEEEAVSAVVSFALFMSITDSTVPEATGYFFAAGMMRLCIGRCVHGKWVMW